MTASPATDDDASKPSRRATPWVNAALTVSAVVLTLASVESGYRAAAGLPAFRLVNWRAEQAVQLEYKAIVDPVLGWTLKPWHRDDIYSTIDYGIRPNAQEQEVRTGGVLAVGDSFTQGWEVDDDETWPAYLEQMIGVPVVNAGVGGYGTDQIVLRAEQMLPVVRPKILIIGFLEADMFRAGHAVFGAPKPYFTMADGEPLYHPPDLLGSELAGRGVDSLWLGAAYGARHLLGYSAAAHALLSRLAPDFWQSANLKLQNRKAGNDPGEVTCALLQRLKATTARDGIPMALLMQHHAPLLFDTENSTPVAQQVVACAQAAGIRVVDQFASLRAIALKDPRNLVEYYAGMYSGAIYGHMTAKGNEHAAGLVAAAIGDWVPAPTKAADTSADLSR